VLDKKPFVLPLACVIVIFGVLPPLEDKGLDAVTFVTVPPLDGLVFVIVKFG
jgi:hypothetical protein